MRNAIMLLTLLLPAAVWAGELPQRPFVSVHAQGTVSVAPDMYTLSVSIQRTEQVTETAKHEVDAVSGKVIALAREAGIADKDITASQVLISPDYRYENGKQIYKGTRVTRSINLILRDIGKYPTLVDGLAKTGLTQLQGVQPGRSDAEALTRKALAQAVQKAEADAAALAQAAHAQLGSVFSLEESGGRPMPRFEMARAASPRNGPELLPGQITIQATVSAVYLLKPR